MSFPTDELNAWVNVIGSEADENAKKLKKTKETTEVVQNEIKSANIDHTNEIDVTMKALEESIHLEEEIDEKRKKRDAEFDTITDALRQEMIQKHSPSIEEVAEKLKKSLAAEAKRKSDENQAEKNYLSVLEEQLKVEDQRVREELTNKPDVEWEAACYEVYSAKKAVEEARKSEKKSMEDFNKFCNSLDGKTNDEIMSQIEAADIIATHNVNKQQEQKQVAATLDAISEYVTSGPAETAADRLLHVGKLVDGEPTDDSEVERFDEIVKVLEQGVPPPETLEAAFREQVAAWKEMRVLATKFRRLAQTSRDMDERVHLTNLCLRADKCGVSDQDEVSVLISEFIACTLEFPYTAMQLKSSSVEQLENTLPDALSDTTRTYAATLKFDPQTPDGLLLSIVVHFGSLIDDVNMIKSPNSGINPVLTYRSTELKNTNIFSLCKSLLLSCESQKLYPYATPDLFPIVDEGVEASSVLFKLSKCLYNFEFRNDEKTWATKAFRFASLNKQSPDVEEFIDLLCEIRRVLISINHCYYSTSMGQTLCTNSPTLPDCIMYSALMLLQSCFITPESLACHKVSYAWTEFISNNVKDGKFEITPPKNFLQLRKHVDCWIDKALDRKLRAKLVGL